MQTAENIKIGILAPRSLRGEHSTLLKPRRKKEQKRTTGYFNEA